MSDLVGAILAGVLNKTILVSAVVVSMKLLSEGIYLAAAGIVLSLVFLAYLSFADARLFR